MIGTEQKRVSYLVSTRNRAPFLARTLANVAEFLTDDDELIIMDGGSTDDTRRVVEEFGDLVTTFESAADLGEAHGYNKGIWRARGRYLKLITDDDYTFPEGMRAAIRLLEDHPEIDAIYCGGERWQLDEQTGEQRFHSNVRLPAGVPLAGRLESVLDHTACGLGLVLTRKVLERVGVFDVSYRAVDVDMLTRLCTSGADFRYADIQLFRHYIYPHSAQNAEAVLARDWARALIRAGRLDLVPRLASHGRPLTEALGLSRVRGGAALGSWILTGELLRRGGALRGLLSVADWAAAPLPKLASKLSARRARPHAALLRPEGQSAG
jgi:glycosyltransferase involved in cell wall biosynthesis